MKWLAALIVAGFIAWPSLGHAGELAAPTGPVVLTVVGAVGSTNRGAYDESEDVFFKYHERSFTQAAAFDLAMLEALGLHHVTVAYDQWPGPSTFEGPLLADVLAAAGAGGRDVAVLALDGFASEISAADQAAEDWIVAEKRDGHYLGLGGRGPLWVLYAPRDGQPATQDDENRWPWASFMIEAK